MHAETAGRSTVRLTRPVTAMVVRGNNTPILLEESKTPTSPDGPPNAPPDPGYVRARTTGKADCIEKYTGKRADCAAKQGVDAKRPILFAISAVEDRRAMTSRARGASIR